MLSKTKIFAATYILLIVAVAFVAWKQRMPKQESGEHPTLETAEETRTPSNLKEYKDLAAGYSFLYPSDVFKIYDKEMQIGFLNTKKEVPAIALVHTIPVRHCGLSGLPQHCTPTTTDLSISFAVIDYPTETIQQSKGGADLKPIILGGRNFLAAEYGAEGEGTIYYYLTLSPSQTLWITRSYINEAVAGGYKKADGFIPYARQEEIFSEIMKKFKRF